MSWVFINYPYMKKQVDEMSIPHLFKCPISLDLFKDPVTLCTGQTYDRSSIEKWLSAGNLTCPVTMQNLHDPSMVPNHTLRHFMNQWLQMGNQFDPQYLQTIDSLSSLKRGLESRDEGTLESKVQALEKIGAFSQLESPSRNNLLLQLGFLPLLLELVLGGGQAELKQKLCKQWYHHIEFVEQALSCIVTLLSLGELESLNMLREESKLAAFQDLFAHGTTLMRMSLCRLIEAASMSPETKGVCSMLGKNSELLHQILAQLLHQNSNSDDGDAAIKAVSAFSSLKEDREFLVEQGTVNGLISYMISSTERHEKSLATLAVATLEKLLGLESAREAVTSNPNGIQALVKMVFSVSDDHGGSESAVGSLIILCNDSLPAREEAISGGVLTQLLLLLQSQCSGGTKTKARMLLKLLRIKWSQEADQLL
ncbi:U-box domain-containing protein 26-like [Pyrus communis]|uniref:U-box domain-containing protein 26-like n=1 Tax=Pyrus communis TaxID=23211 RepID=UPI0035C0AE73